MVGLILAGAGIIDIVIAAVIDESIARTVVFASGVTTILVGLFLFVAGLKQDQR